MCVRPAMHAVGYEVAKDGQNPMGFSVAGETLPELRLGPMDGPSGWVERMRFDWTESNPRSSRAMAMLCRSTGSTGRFCPCPGRILLGRNDYGSAELRPDGSDLLSWRCLYPGFPQVDSAIRAGWELEFATLDRGEAFLDKKGTALEGQKFLTAHESVRAAHLMSPSSEDNRQREPAAAEADAEPDPPGVQVVNLVRKKSYPGLRWIPVVVDPDAYDRYPWIFSKVLCSRITFMD